MEADLLAGIAAAAAVINSGLVIWNFLQSPSKKNADAIQSLNGKVEKLEKAIGDHDATLKNLPTQQAFHDMQLTVERTNADIRVMGESLRAVRETSNLMRDWLLEKGVK